jgi:thiol-disulfide isomerase/thioredoxin
MKTKTTILIIVGVILVAILFFMFNSNSNSDQIQKSVQLPQTNEENVEENVEETHWTAIKLKNVNDNLEFSVDQFEKPVLLETFAVWCPTCKKQQDEIKKLHEEVGDAVISISLDTDPNENEGQVINHAQKHGYTWRYAISPPEFTQQLLDEFGVKVVNAPSAPIILICNNEAQFLESGVKSANELKTYVEAC